MVEFENGLEVLRKNIIKDIQEIFDGKSTEDVMAAINRNFKKHNG